MARWLLLLTLVAPAAHADTDTGDTDAGASDTDTDAEEWVEGEPAAHLAGEAGGARGCEVVLGASSAVLAAVGAALALSRRPAPGRLTAKS